jgi:hypothetical protein
LLVLKKRIQGGGVGLGGIEQRLLRRHRALPWTAERTDQVWPQSW